MSHTGILKNLTDKIYKLKDDTRDFMVDTISSQEAYKDLMGIPVDEIPLHINQYSQDSYQYFILTCRLKGKNPLEVDITRCIELLWDCEFSVDDYKEIGYNDGMIDTLNLLLRILGDEKAAQETMLLKYNE